jgi:hypothetical protein
MLVLVPSFYLAYGPLNFLWLCDLALWVTWLGLWLESPLIIGMQAVAVLIPQLIWLVLFLVQAATGVSALGFLDNMFDARIPLFVRALSLFHGWMPLLLIWLLMRLGYDRRALWAQAPVVVALLGLTYVLLGQSPAKAGNVNGVLGLTGSSAVHGWAWVALLGVALLLVVCLPTHWLLCRFFRPPIERS